MLGQSLEGDWVRERLRVILIIYCLDLRLLLAHGGGKNIADMGQLRIANTWHALLCAATSFCWVMGDGGDSGGE